MWEVVGPGFDASDIKRGDLNPHQRLELPLQADPPRYSSRWTATPEGFRLSVQDRLDKLAKTLGVRPAEVPQVLASQGHPLLGRSLDRYQPVGDAAVAAAHRDLRATVAALAALGMPGPPWS